MKKLFFILALAAVMTSQAQVVRTPVKEFKLFGPVAILSPFATNKVNAKGDSFSLSNMANDDYPLSLSQKGKDWSGIVLPSLQNAQSVSVLSFFIDAEKYIDGKLIVKGGKNRKVYIDGKEMTGDKLKLTPYRHEVVLRYFSEPSARDSVSVAIESKGGVTVTGNAKRNYTTYDCLDGLRTMNSSLSPNGKYIIIQYKNTERGGKNHYYVQLKELATKRVIAEKNIAAHMSWMPRSDAYTYESKDSGSRCLYKVDVVTGISTLLASHLPDGNITMSPDESYLVINGVEEGTKERPEIFEVLEPDDRQPGWRNRSYLSKYNLKTGALQRLTFGSYSSYLNDISQDGSCILFSVSHSRLTKRPTTVTSFYRMDAATLKVDTIMKDAEFINNCQFSPDKKKILVFAQPEAFGGIGLNIDKGQIASMTEGEIFILDPNTRKVTPMTKEFNPSVTGTTWAVCNGQIYFTAEDKDYVRIYSMNPASGKIHSIDAAEDVVTDYSIAGKAHLLSYIGQSASNSFRLYTYNIKEKKSNLVEDCSKTILKDVVLGECRDWNFLSSRGDTIYGRYYLPANFDASKKYPLIVNYYGGCSPTGRTMESRYPAHAYAAQGYIVYVVQPSGATGFGQKFAARHVNTWGEGPAEDIIEGTKKICAEHPFIDGKKVGCIGASYGGFMTTYLQTKTDIFAAAVSHAGISDITSYWGEGYWGYSYSEVASAGKYPWNARDMYTKQSPLFNADKIHTPILFTQGTNDTNVPIGESIQMFTALKLLGRETAFVEVNGENHQILSYDKRLLWQDTIFAWFAKYLKNDSDWWESLYPKKAL
jgi:dipeptidyl aminopeptidase/acylaminoacyl peptidase